jgi:hypothetical protein
VTLVELPSRRPGPRLFVEPEPGFQRRVERALKALGDLPDDLDLPGLDDLADALIALADEIEGDADLEDEEAAEVEALPLLAHAGLLRPT